MLVFSTCIPGRHAPGRTILLYNHSYQVLLYSYKCSAPFLELLQRQRSHLLKLYTVAVLKSQLKHSAPSSSPPTVPWFYSSPLCEKKWEESRLGVASPLMISETEHLGSEAHYLTPSASLQGQNLRRSRVSRQDSTNMRASTPAQTGLSFFFPFPQNRKGVI